MKKYGSFSVVYGILRTDWVASDSNYHVAEKALYVIISRVFSGDMCSMPTMCHVTQERRALLTSAEPTSIVAARQCLFFPV